MERRNKRNNLAKPMRTRTKPEQAFHDGRMKLTWRKFLAKVRFVMIHGGFVKNPEFD
jgi:hypothetical protein